MSQPRKLHWFIQTLKWYEELRATNATFTHAVLAGSAEAVSRVENHRDLMRVDGDIATWRGRDRIQLLCEEMDSADGLTAANVVKLRAKLCRAKPCSLQEANVLTLDEVADVLEAANSFTLDEAADSASESEQACELADGQLFIKGEPFRLEPTEWAVLKAIAEHGALNKRQLKEESHVDENDAAKILKNLETKYQRRGLRIRLAGKRAWAVTGQM